jgi:hypothetical protein
VHHPGWYNRPTVDSVTLHPKRKKRLCTFVLLVGGICKALQSRRSRSSFKITTFCPNGIFMTLLPFSQ